MDLSRCLCLIFLISNFYGLVLSSIGDQSTRFRECLSKCFSKNCSSPTLEQKFVNQQNYPEKLLAWSCSDECKYNCMWDAVALFQKHEHQVPQFYGKWPFVRILGLQEPASVIFSILNLIPHILMQIKFRKSVTKLAPMFSIWTLYGLVSINTWTWSTVFHARDNPFTEMMDYFCAFSVVSFSLLAFFIRLFGSHSWKSVISTAFCVAMFIWHVYNMAFVHFDYGYNMIINISVGAVNSICWLAWCYWHRKDYQHVSKCVTTVLLLNASIALELLDFSPILWTLDSHALWHLSTSPIHFIWYSFIIEDCKILAAKSKITDKKAV